MTAIHFSTLPVTNAKPWSHPSLTLLQPRRRTLHLYLMLLSAAQVRPALCNHVAYSAWCFCPEASSPDSPQARSCRPFLSLLKCPLGTDPSPDTTAPSLRDSSTALTTCLPAGGCIALLSVSPRGWLCLSRSLLRLRDPQDDGSLWRCGV